MTSVAAPSAAWPRRATLTAAAVSIVTMPLTAMWFLLLGGILLVVGLLPGVVRGGPVGRAAWTGLGLLVGPAIYLSLAIVTA